MRSGHLRADRAALSQGTAPGFELLCFRCKRLGAMRPMKIRLKSSEERSCCGHGIVTDLRGQDQPADMARAQHVSPASYPSSRSRDVRRRARIVLPTDIVVTVNDRAGRWHSQRSADESSSRAPSGWTGTPRRYSGARLRRIAAFVRPLSEPPDDVAPRASGENPSSLCAEGAANTISGERSPRSSGRAAAPDMSHLQPGGTPRFERW